ncbi:unnamed protein product [Adineta ricciae]|uniref:Uncharacterized protein n=1 Tax=Adineta ricciae TaxID=249248 RepID=A0A814T7D0_ADIRI|nr:unnamed protein product [Adineta ricciae]CAF1296660.1 unnamed protein product [Adineta ricciae]
MTIVKFLFICLFPYISIIDSSHFRGGTITYRPFNNTPSGSTVPVIVRERWSWRRSSSSPVCSPATIAAKSPTIGGGTLTCVSGSYCPSWPGMTISTYCTDFSAPLDVASGEYYQTYNIPLNVSFSLGFTGGAWFSYLVIGHDGSWSVVARISTIVRPDGYLNTSPIAVSLPILYKEINIQHVHVVQMSDFDGTDTLKCRWSIKATTAITQYDECADVCSGITGANLIGENCTIVFTLYTAGWYVAAALQIEDFYNAAAVTANTPMSSVPLQFLFYGYANPGGCTTPPAIIGNRPNRACIGVLVGDNVTEVVVIQVYCTGKTITEYVSSVPAGMTKSAILNPSTGIYNVILSWIPVSDQYGPQAVCFGAVDNTNIQTNQWCITFLVGFKSPDVIRPKLVQGSASPIGTVFQNQTTFSIQTSISVNRPTRNGTYIYFYYANGTLVQKYDCGWEPEVTYTGYTIVIRFPVAPWEAGAFYYVNMDSGVASGTEFCGPESAPITDPTFWIFNIWNPALSSTTTTTTTPFTTVTVTTKPTSTTSINTLLTTTGIVITTTIPPTTTSTTLTTTPSTTPAPTTPTPTSPALTTESTVAILYPKDIENICLQPIAIMNAVFLAAMMPVQALATFAIFTKLSNTFNPAKLKARIRHKQRVKKIMKR